MTTPTPRDPYPQTAQHNEFSLQRISQLISDLEQELANAPQDDRHIQDLREEVDTLKHTLASSPHEEGWVRENLHKVRDALQETTARVEGDVLAGSPYIAEIGRILGMV